MALRRPPTTFSDQITDADIGADSIGTSELKNDAVETANIKDSTGASDGITSAKIATDAVIAAKIATGAVVADGIGAGAVVTAGLGASAVTKEKMAASAIEVKPHIIPGVLYPAIKDGGGTVRQVDGVTAVVASTTGPAGSTVASSLYGTVQSDGRMYYYTDIKGSKPIKDPRIGSHFGSQRHKTKSVQLLEQETATHGTDVYSIDGREWLRGVGAGISGGNDGNGNYVNITDTNSYCEITGYFSNFNFSFFTATNRKIRYSLDGTEVATDYGETSVTTPLSDRFVPAGSLVNLPISITLGIHTIKIRRSGSSNIHLFDIELIAQDTSNVNNIQIPSQNVVSYGKKFTVAETKHYNPFAFKTDGSTAWASGAHNGTAWPIGTGSSTNIDTATSLGLAAWVSTNYYKPYNGGRVVKWIASDGTIKTSVNVMPPNARSIGNSASLTNATAKANASIANNTYFPTMEAGTVDHSQAEVAKTFHWREFGNGSANGNASYADASMLNTQDDIAYVMDDGLTSLSGDDVAYANDGIRPGGPSKSIFITFIGSGIGGVRYRDGSTTEDRQTWAQNLPYGTHILKLERDGSNYQRITVDGVLLETNSTTALYLIFGEQTIYQPKMPPIPEDAVVIADYMLMADFVREADPTAEADRDRISKGVRMVSPSRDIFANNIDAFYAGGVVSNADVGSTGFYLSSSSTASANASDSEWQLPAFGTTFIANGHSGTSRNDVHIDGVDVAHSGTSNAHHSAIVYPDSAVALGQHTFAIHGVNSVGYSPYLSGKGFQIASPIHTSSHYQTFETPFLHELVGGDRNMEQTNLVVTPDGKTWDEVTRDVSYMGPSSGFVVSSDNGDQSASTEFKPDLLRGAGSAVSSYHNKDFAIAYDRMICLVDGEFEIKILTESSTNAGQINVLVRVNGSNVLGKEAGNWTSTRATMELSHTMNLKRGDFLTWVVNSGTINSDTDNQTLWSCKRIN